MQNRKRSIYIFLPLVILLAACASLKLPGTSSSGTSSQSGQNQQGQPFDMAKQPVEQKLAAGILLLEGTDKAVTEEQARALLPLWKAVKVMSTSATASADEVNALYQQIEEAMTADQVQAIKDLSLTPEDMQGLMKKFGIQAPMMGQNPNGTPMARRTSRTQSGNGTNGGANNGGPQAGGGPGGGFPGGDMGGGMPPDGGGFPGGNGQSTTRGTPQPGAANRGGFRGGFNNLFIDPLIKVLQERAGVSAAVTPTAQ